jgi:hypothetical protein
MRTNDATGLAREWLKAIEEEWPRYCPAELTAPLRERLQRTMAAHLGRDLPDVLRGQAAIVRATIRTTDTPVAAALIANDVLHASWLEPLPGGASGPIRLRTEWVPLRHVERVDVESVIGPDGEAPARTWTFQLVDGDDLVVRGVADRRPQFGDRLFDAVRGR